MDYDTLIANLPEVDKPKRRLSFEEKLKWTGLVLVLYFILGQLPLYGLSKQAVDYFANLRAIVAGSFGSIITLGISPIVTASIILQLLVGVELLPFDINTPEGRRRFQGSQKLVAIGFTFFEAAVYVISGGLPPARPGDPYLIGLLIAQLFAGGLLIILLDEVVSKWGFGSGVSLFIAAGVSTGVVVGTFSPVANPNLPGVPTGRLWYSLMLLSQGQPQYAVSYFLPVIFTVIVFSVAVYSQAMKIEIPLSVTRVRGYTTKWPLRFIYTSNIPVILAAAVLANLQLWGRLMAQRGFALLGTFQGTEPTGGLVYFLNVPRGLLADLTLEIGNFMIGLSGVTGGNLNFSSLWFFRIFSDAKAFIASLSDPAIMTSFYSGCPAEVAAPYTACVFLGDGALGQLLQACFYLFFMILGSVVFSLFWVRTANMDAPSVAKQIQQANMLRRGFRQDPRMIERLLNRYIPSLTVMGGAFVGVLAAFADLTNSLGGGTGLLLTVMIIYNLYEEIHTQHMMDMFPSLRRFMKG